MHVRKPDNSVRTTLYPCQRFHQFFHAWPNVQTINLATVTHIEGFTCLVNCYTLMHVFNIIYYTKKLGILQIE